MRIFRRAGLGGETRILYDTAIALAAALWFLFATVGVASTSDEQRLRLDVARATAAIASCFAYAADELPPDDSGLPFASAIVTISLSRGNSIKLALPGNYRRRLEAGNCTICSRRCHFVFEIRKGFDDQIAELQQGADLILQFLKRFGLIGVVMKVVDEIIEVIVWSMGWGSGHNIHPRLQCT